jgi:hypothetical protein
VAETSITLPDVGLVIDAAQLAERVPSTLCDGTAPSARRVALQGLGGSC